MNNMFVDDEEVYVEWAKYHTLWMTKNVPKEILAGFNKQLKEFETHASDSHKQGFMLFHLMHVSTLPEDADYLYLKEAREVWLAAPSIVQAFHSMMMAIAVRNGNEDAANAIGLGNACIIQMLNGAGVPNEEE